MPNYPVSICPFYERESDKSITCEGFVCDNCLTQIRFMSDRDKLKFQSKYCRRDNWASCPLAIQLAKKYEEE